MAPGLDPWGLADDTKARNYRGIEKVPGRGEFRWKTEALLITIGPRGNDSWWGMGSGEWGQVLTCACGTSQDLTPSLCDPVVVEGTSVPTLRPSRCVISTQSRLAAPELRLFWLAQFS